MATALVLSITFAMPVAAQDSNVVSIADATTTQGSSEIVPIRIYNATGIASVGVKLSYNASVVNVTGATQGDFTAFFGFDNSHAADGWVTINTYIMGTDLTGNLTVANVTLEAVGNAGDSSPLNLEILTLSDKFGSDVQGTTDNGTFRIQADNTAPIVKKTYTEPIIIPEDTDGVPLWGEMITIDVTDGSNISTVRVDLSDIGGSAITYVSNAGNYSDGTFWCVFNVTNASVGTAEWNATSSTYESYYLSVNATDIYSNSNTSVSIELIVMKNGDATGEGSVNIGDAMLLANNVSFPGQGYVISSEFVAEVTGNSVVDIGDAMLLANNVSFPGQGYILR